MQLPDRYQICLTKKEFSEGLTTKLLDFVEQIPEEVFEVAQANIETFQKSS
jgi:pantothenate kinase